MTVLEATVEVVKAIVGTNTANQAYLITDSENRGKLLAGIEEIYKKLDGLAPKTTGRQS